MDIKDIDFSKLAFKSGYLPTEAHAMISIVPLYNGEPFVIRTKPIKITKYGLPIKEFWDQSRKVFNIPLDQEQDSCIELIQFFLKLEDFLEGKKDEIIDKAFNKSGLSKQYVFKSKIQKADYGYDLDESDDEDNEDNIYNTKDKFPTMFSVDYLTKKIKTQFRIHKLVKDNDLEFLIEQKLPDDSINGYDDLTGYYKYNDTCRFMIHIDKLFVHKAKMYASGKREYSYTTRIVRMDITPTAKEKKKNMNDIINQDDPGYEIKDTIGDKVILQKK